MNRTRRDDPLDGLRPPGPPEDLAGRVLDAAREALVAGPSTTLWDRLWESRAWRLAWTASTAGLLAMHAAMSFAPGDATARGRPDPETARAVRDLEEILDLPRVENLTMDLDALTGSPATSDEDSSDARHANGGA